jgi:hypothetical protein
VVLDDLHWAEATFLDLVEYLVGWTRDAPVLLCALARPDLLDTRPAWADSTRVTLHGLPGDDARRLAQNLLGPLDDRLLDELVSRAEGNPLFVEETLRMLVDDGSLVRDGSEWRLRRELVRPRVPATVQAVLASRLDRLPAAELAVLQRASVIGQVFWWGAVNALGAPDERSAVGARLHALVRRQLVEPAASALVAEDSFRFGHILVRDTVYESIAKRERAVLHERFASWVEERARTGLQQFDEILAHHLEQAYRYRVELAPPDEETRALGRRAGAVLAVAGRGALRRGDAPAAANLLGRAAPLVEEERFDLLLELAAALRDAGDFAGAVSALDEAAAAAESAGRRALVDVERGWLAFYTDPSQGFDALLDTARAASPLLEREEDERGLVRALLLEAYAQFTSCRVAQMEEVLRRALVHAERTGRRRDTVVVLAGLARAAVVGPAPVEEALGRCRELGARNPGSRWLEGVLASCASYLEAMAGRFEEARALYSLGQETLEEAGQTVALGAACTYAGAAELLAGDAVAAERELRRGFALLEAIEETGNLSTLAAVLAEALGAQGKAGEAAELTRLSEGVASPDDVTSQIAWRSVRARLLAGAGEVEAALGLAVEAVALAGAADTPNLDAEAHAAHAVTLRAAGREEEATAAERLALGSYERKGNVAAAAALGSARGGGTVAGTEA